MTQTSGSRRIDTASKIIRSSPQTIYQAFVNPEALVSWLPPEGMTGRIYEFDVRAGGAYRMSLTYVEPDHAGRGKASEHEDIVEGTFLAVVPNERIVQAVTFESDDPAFAGDMIMTWRLAAAPGGTEVTIVCENVPEGIRKEDHDVGLKSSLDNLAAFVERSV